MEDYLKAIYRLQEDDGRVSTQALSRELALSGASVTNMVKRLAELGLVAHSRYYGVRLTDAGTRVALEVIRHHRLLELYLAEAMGYDWDAVHDEAERLEHHVSEEFESRMDTLLGHPEFDPHGDPIPSLKGDLPDAEWHTLTDEPVGSVLVLRRVSDRDADDLRFLKEIGLAPGVEFSVTERDLNGGCTIKRAEATHHISPQLAASMQVERQKPHRD
jgi:DtxR family Mn-dependent transcriptional regulator